MVRHVLSKGLGWGVRCMLYMGHGVDLGVGSTQGGEETGLRWSVLQEERRTGVWAVWDAQGAGWNEGQSTRLPMSPLVEQLTFKTVPWGVSKAAVASPEGR